MTALAFAAMLVWSLAMLVLVGSATCALLHPRLARRQASHRARPPVSIVIPLKADGAGLGLATASAATLAYPACDITLCAADAASPALAVARSALGACLVPWRVAISRDGEGNPKVANIAAALGSARAEFVLVKDAGTILPPDVLDAMVAALGAPVGLVVAVPLARDIDGLAAEVEAAFLNGYGARMVLAASALGLGVGIGAAMLFRRGDLARADGLRAMAESVADDHALAKAMARIGLATRCASVPVWQAVGRRDMADVWTRHRRWAICRRIEEPLAFHAEPWLGAAMAVPVGWDRRARASVSARARPSPPPLRPGSSSRQGSRRRRAGR